MEIVYKCKETGYVYKPKEINQLPPKGFNGYRIQYEYGKLSNITEISNNEVLARIVYRPTKTPIIEKVEYNGHKQNRYNNNNVSSVYYESNNSLYGEYKKYDIRGNLIERKYFLDNVDVTTEVMNFVGYNGSYEEFMKYTFREDEQFNLMMKYGFNFRFCHESDIEKLDYTYITEYCQHI